MKLQIKALSDKIGKEIPLPYYATDGAAALDLHACIDRALTVLPGEQVMVPSGIAAAVPDGYVGIMAVRSVKHCHSSMPRSVLIFSNYPNGTYT